MRWSVSRKPAARRDLIEIWRHIAEDNEPAADRRLDRIEQLLRMLLETPKAGRRRDELAPDLRSFPIGNDNLSYQHAGPGIVLIRVLSARLDIHADDFE